ncbi:MAG: DUF2183 domain-containing protein [Woeseiaceae bacterium]|nr:DUF2183 domain-containing protein [Woeseiaceae bacterium]
MLRSLLLVAVLAAAGCTGEAPAAAHAPNGVTDIKPDEHLVFFNTSAWLDESGAHWQIPVHGWVYEPEDSTFRRSVFETVLEEQFELEVTEANEDIFARRLNLLIADNERNKNVAVQAAGQHFVLPPSAESGQFSETLTIPAADVESHAENGMLRITAVLGEHDDRSFEGIVKLVPPAGTSVISDIDDTVKISGVLDKKTLLDYTFLREFEAAPGMARTYRDWSTQGASFHFVSSSPWQLYAPLDEFLEREGFPWATFNLKLVRFRDETFLDLFKKGTDTKPKIIENILSRYPNRKFVLVGDSGEQDPEVYANLMRSHPEQIFCVLIRNVSDESPDNQRFTTLFGGFEANSWMLFDDPDLLPDVLAP